MANDDEFYDSLEQAERARSWFQNNSSSLMIGILGAMAVIWGYKAFESNKVRSAHEAGLGYELLAKAVQDKEESKISQLSAELRKSHADSTYAALGNLAEAKHLQEAAKIDAAEIALRQAMTWGESEQVKQIASLRLARLLNGKGKAQDALAVLAGISDEGFKASVQQLKGDCYLQLAKLAEAKAAYAAALTATDLAAPGRASLQQKLDNLGS